jgi:hypothetical protein
MNSPRAALIDGHVHFHQCFDAVPFVETAYGNFVRAAGTAGCEHNFAAFLLLVETFEAHWFDDLAELARTHGSVGGGWGVRATADPCQLKLVGSGGRELNVISGYQIVTAEKLEVLALGSRDRVRDGLPIRDVIRRVKASNALAVVPWGFGKWLGRRGKLVRDLVEAAESRGFYLGDNSNRLAGLPEPAIFGRARAAGFEILPGTDPLPFPKEAARAGTAGFLYRPRSEAEDLDSWPVVRARLEEPSPITPFGHLESLPSFVKNQIAMQIYKRTQPTQTTR